MENVTCKSHNCQPKKVLHGEKLSFIQQGTLSQFMAIVPGTINDFQNTRQQKIELTSRARQSITCLWSEKTNKKFDH